MAIDKSQLFASIGQREGRINNHIKTDEGAVLAAAAVTRVLVQLREHAFVKPVTGTQIQALIDSFFESSGMEEVEAYMGGVVYRRKVAA